MDVFNRCDCGVSVVLPTGMPYQWEDTIIVGKPLSENLEKCDFGEGRRLRWALLVPKQSQRCYVVFSLRATVPELSNLDSSCCYGSIILEATIFLLMIFVLTDWHAFFFH